MAFVVVLPERDSSRARGWGANPHVLTDPVAKGPDAGRQFPAVWHPVVELETALTTTWTTDAHMLPYHATMDGRPLLTLPRLKQGSRPFWPAGMRVLFDCIVFDVDDPVVHGKKPPIPARDEWRADVEPCVVGLPGPPLSYRTRGGLRLVWRLPEAIDCDDYRALYLRTLRFLHTAGVPADVTCDDWTRCYRLPLVARKD